MKATALGVTPKQKEEDPNYDKYAVESATSTLMKAHEHLNDKKMMGKIKKHIKKQKKAFTSIQQLKDYANNKYGPNPQDEEAGEPAGMNEASEKE